MSELPEGWAEATIADVADYVSRGRSPKYIGKSGLPVINQRCVRWHGVDESHVKFVDPATWHQWDEERFVRPDDILWNSTGTGTIGRAALFDALPSYDKAVVDSHVTIVRSNAAIDPKLLFALIQSPNVQDKIEDMQSGSTNQVELNRSEILGTPVPLPPFPEQRRIVEKVDGLTARTARARKELSRIPTLIARYKQRLLAIAFSGELLGGTEGWRTATIGDLAETQLGKMLDKAKNKGESTKYLRNINVRWYNFELDDVLEMPMSDGERRKFSIADGDILTCEGGEPGRSAIWNNGPTDIAFQKALIRIRPDLEQLNPSYLVHHLKYLANAQELEKHFTGSTIKHLPQRALQNVKLPVPPIEEQAEIVRRIESAFGWLDRMAADHAAAARLLPKLDAAILSKAFQGKLVPQDPNDEPASVLLERIKSEREDAPKKTRGRQPKVTNISGEAAIKFAATATLTDAPKKSGAKSMTKSRQDDDVKDKPYLAGLLKTARRADVQTLFRASDLPVADFYKQLAWEIDAKHIIDSADELKAA